MAKFTVEELYYGDKYYVMGGVVREIFLHQKEFANDPDRFIELEVARQTLIAVEKMKKNGDSIAEGELRDTVVTFL